jgi:hypothetical protein
MNMNSATIVQKLWNYCNVLRLAEEQKPAYFAAVQSGLDRNYQPMERLFAEIIERSLATS